MQRIRLRPKRLWAVSGAVELLLGTVLFVFGRDIPSLAEAGPRLFTASVLLVCGGLVLLLMARLPMDAKVRRALVFIPILPLFILSLALRSDPLKPLMLMVMLLVLLISPWLPEGQRERRNAAVIWADLPATVLGFLLVLAGLRFLITPDRFTPEAYSLAGYIPWLFGLLALAGAAALLSPLTGRSLLEPWTFAWRITGGLVPALLAALSILVRSWDSLVFWGIWALVILRGIPVRGWITDRDEGVEDLERVQEDQIQYMERVLEVWMWAVILMVMIVSTLGEHAAVGRWITTIFVLGMGIYNALMHLVLPDLGSPERRIFWHLLFLTVAVGFLMMSPEPVYQNFLAVLVITPFLAARLLGVRHGLLLLGTALVMSALGDVVDWFITGKRMGPSGLAAVGFILIKFAILIIAGWLGIHSAVEQRRLVRELDQARAAQKAQIRQLEQLANYDSLTGLFNRRRFREELDRVVAAALKRGTSGALFFLDLDGFKYINDSLGHQAGDELLKGVAQLLKANVRGRDTVCRLGGDEFAVILPEATREEAVAVANRILEAARRHKIVYNGHQMKVTPSIGIVLFPEHGVHSEELISHADVAMYQVKESGRNGIHVFTPENAEIGVTKLAWEKRIRDALENDGFVLYAQPIVQVSTRQVAMYELLLRMAGEGGEMIAPRAFLSVAERFGLIQEIDRWVVRKAIQLVAKYRRSRQFALAVNISGKSLADPELLPLIRRELRITGIDPRQIVLEITETAAIHDVARAAQFINTLRHEGFRFAVDDFGTGYSTFAYLKQLNVDFLKIDGNFIRDLSRDERDRLFVSSLVRIAKGFGMETVVEFVDNAETFAMLKKLGVDYAQGYYLGRPAPLAQVLQSAEA